MALLSADLLVMKQVTQFMSNDFDILDSGGAVLGVGHTEGSLPERLFLGPRRIGVRDADGTPLLTVTDPLQFLRRDRMTITDGRGRPLAEVVKRIALRTSLEVAMTSGGGLLIRGSWLQREFDVVRNGVAVATITRKLATLEEFLGYGRYAIRFAPGQDEELKRVVIGAAIAVDLIRRKQRSGSG